jgi:hypothetical protein
VGSGDAFVPSGAWGSAPKKGDYKKGDYKKGGYKKGGYKKGGYKKED